MDHGPPHVCGGAGADPPPRRVFQGHGLGVRRERGELQRWECGQSTVALVLGNCPEYVETMIGAYRARAVPFNVNHHYAPGEIGALLDQLGAEAVVYHRRLGPKLAGDVGCFGVLVDDFRGGGSASGNGVADAALIAAERGARLQPEPYVGTSVTAHTLSRVGSQAWHGVLGALVSGQTAATWAVGGLNGHALTVRSREVFRSARNWSGKVG